MKLTGCAPIVAVLRLMPCVMMLAMCCRVKEAPRVEPPPETPPAWTIEFSAPKCSDSLWAELHTTQGTIVPPMEVTQAKHGSAVVWSFKFAPIHEEGKLFLLVRDGTEPASNDFVFYSGFVDSGQVLAGLSIPALTEGVELDFSSLHGPEIYPDLSGGEWPYVWIETEGDHCSGSRFRIPLADGGREKRVVVPAIHPGSYRFCIISGAKAVPVGKFCVPAFLPPSSVLHVERVVE